MITYPDNGMISHFPVLGGKALTEVAENSEMACNTSDSQVISPTTWCREPANGVNQFPVISPAPVALSLTVSAFAGATLVVEMEHADFGGTGHGLVSPHLQAEWTMAQGRPCGAIGRS